MNNSKINFGGTSFGVKKKPVKIIYSDKENIEADSLTELNELQIAFREKAKKEKELQDTNTDSEFWSCIVFRNRQQRDQLYEILKISQTDNQYINGKKLIDALELKINIIEAKQPGKFRCNAEILNLSIEP